MDPLFARRRRYEAVLRAVGLGDAFAAMKRFMQDGFLREKFPDPILEFDSTYPDDADHRALRKTLEAAFQKATMEVNGAEVAVRDFVGIIIGLSQIIEHSRHDRSLPNEVLAFMDVAGPRCKEWNDRCKEDAWIAYFFAVASPLVGRTRLDRLLFNSALRCEPNERGKPQVRMIVSAAKPEIRRITLDGAERPTYRVATANEWNGIRPLSWDAQQWRSFGLAGPDGEYPVYVQSHALRHLHERINLHKAMPYLEYWMYTSLAKPNVIERRGEELLVEYRIQDDRLGYLIVTPVARQRLAVVRTFLFLTMENTPEARQLRKRLRLLRPDVEYLGLDDLAVYTQTDLQNDDELRAHLEACGCGHLFDLAVWSDDAFAPRTAPFAAEMRKYLRMAA